MGQILVGVDGSNDSRAALEWAVDQARLTGASVRAVYVYGLSEEHNPFLAAYSSFAGSGTQQTAEHAVRWREERDEATHKQAVGLVTSVVRDLPDADDRVKVDADAVPGGRPARALLQQARYCSLLVVGARGLGGFRGLRLGSVAEKCVRHAPCSVMVARAAT